MPDCLSDCLADSGFVGRMEELAFLSGSYQFCSEYMLVAPSLNSIDNWSHCTPLQNRSTYFIYYRS